MAYLRKVLPLDLQRYLHERYLPAELNVIWTALIGIGDTTSALYGWPEIAYIVKHGYLSILKGHYKDVLHAYGLTTSNAGHTRDIEARLVANILDTAAEYGQASIFGWMIETGHSGTSISIRGSIRGTILAAALYTALDLYWPKILGESKIFRLVSKSRTQSGYRELVELLFSYKVARVTSLLYLSQFALAMSEEAEVYIAQAAQQQYLPEDKRYAIHESMTISDSTGATDGILCSYITKAELGEAIALVRATS